MNSRQHNQNNEMRRHWAVMKQYPGSTSWDEQKARNQAEIALNACLDIYPNGRRPDLSNEEMAGRLEGKSAQRFFTSLGDVGLGGTVGFPAIKAA